MPSPTTVKEYVLLTRQGRQNYWKRADIAVTVFAQEGSAGIEVLSEASGDSVRTIREMASIAQRISPKVRKDFEGMPTGYFVTVYRAKEHFAANSPQSNPEWWLEQAKQKGWTQSFLRSTYRKTHNHKDEIARFPDAATRALAFASEFESDSARFNALGQRLNDKYGDFFGTFEIIFHSAEEQNQFVRAS